MEISRIARGIYLILFPETDFSMQYLINFLNWKYINSVSYSCLCVLFLPSSEVFFLLCITQKYHIQIPIHLQHNFIQIRLVSCFDLFLSFFSKISFIWPRQHLCIYTHIPTCKRRITSTHTHKHTHPHV